MRTSSLLAGSAAPGRLDRGRVPGEPARLRGSTVRARGVTEQGTLRFDVQAHPVCTKGSGAAANGTTILLAVPRSTLPNTGTLTAEVNIAMLPGDKFVPLGSASTSL